MKWCNGRIGLLIACVPLGAQAEESSFPPSAFRLVLPDAPRHELQLELPPSRWRDRPEVSSRMGSTSSSAAGPYAAFWPDAYRASWRYTLQERGNWLLKAGFSAQPRGLDQPWVRGSNSFPRAGLAPGLNLHGEYSFGARTRLTFDGFSLPGGRSRAFDLSARYVRDVSPGASMFAGIRSLDPGADGKLYGLGRYSHFLFGVELRR